jgi:hypothetical protein
METKRKVDEVETGRITLELAPNRLAAELSITQIEHAANQRGVSASGVNPPSLFLLRRGSLLAFDQIQPTGSAHSPPLSIIVRPRLSLFPPPLPSSSTQPRSPVRLTPAFSLSSLSFLHYELTNQPNRKKASLSPAFTFSSSLNLCSAWCWPQRAATYGVFLSATEIEPILPHTHTYTQHITVQHHDFPIPFSMTLLSSAVIVAC